MMNLVMRNLKMLDLISYRFAKVDGEWWEIAHFNLEDDMVWLYGKLTKRGVVVMSGWVDLSDVEMWSTHTQK